jgi:hypothetical protein
MPASERCGHSPWPDTGDAVPSPEDQSPAELRMRALHVRQLAEHFEHDEMRERLQAFAAELDAQADAIEVAAEDGE